MDSAAITTSQQIAATTAANTEQGVVVTKRNELGMDDFFKLLTTQLTSQDPLKPMEDTEFISQMANFSSLAQMESIASNMEEVRKQQESLSVMNLIGKHVQADDGEGGQLEGQVTRVEWFEGELMPYIGEVKVPYKTITNIYDEPFQQTPSDSAGEELPEEGGDGV